jgi:hypothetical protein
MKRSSLLTVLLLLFFACQEQNVELTKIPAKAKNGLVNVLITTQESDSLISNYNYANQVVVSSNEVNFLQGIASLGLIAGEHKMNKVIVIGNKLTHSISNIRKVKPLGVAQINGANEKENWFIFTDQASEINDFDDFMLNYFSKKDKIQEALLRRNKNGRAKVIWYDENFLNSKLNKVLSL